MTVATAEVARSDPRLACAHFSLLRRGTPNRYIAPTFHNRSPEIAHALNFVSALPRNSRPSEQSEPLPSVLAGGDFKPPAIGDQCEIRESETRDGARQLSEATVTARDGLHYII